MITKINLEEMPFHKRNDVWLGVSEDKKCHYHLPAVYFLYNGDELVYIGQTKSLTHRIVGHCAKREVPFDRVKFAIIHCPSERLLLEDENIQKYKPKYNKGKMSDRTIDKHRQKTIQDKLNRLDNVKIFTKQFEEKLSSLGTGFLPKDLMDIINETKGILDGYNKNNSDPIFIRDLHFVNIAVEEPYTL